MSPRYVRAVPIRGAQDARGASCTDRQLHWRRRWSYPLHAYIDTGADLAKVFYRVKGDDADGLFLGTFVSVNNVEKNPTNPKAVMFRVWMLGQANTGRLLLWDDLTDKNGMKLEKGI